MTLESLAGRAFGPVGFTVAAGRVAEFVAATGDDAGRWREFAPPGLAAAAIFAVAPGLLGDPAVLPYRRSLLHAEQAFSWERPLAVGEELAVRGRVAAVRSRGPQHVVGFEVEASGAEGRWVTGAATFLLSSAPAAASDEADEPAFEARAGGEAGQPCPELDAGAVLPPLRRSASRADLVRYATASGDENPIHLDHGAAREAGLPGVIVPGLLLATWFFQAAARCRPSPHPLRAARVRFRRLLRPGVAGVVTGRVSSIGADGAELEMSLEEAGGGPALATATLQVTP